MDTTGPLGQGPMTGRGMGRCGGRAGIGQCRRRIGFGGWFHSTKNELSALQEEEQFLENELSAVREEIKAVAEKK